MAGGTIPMGARVKEDVLWTNSSPGGSFSAQTLQIDWSGYDHILIKMRVATNIALCTVFRLFTSDADVVYGMNMHNFSTDTVYVYSRTAKLTSEGIQFSAGHRNTSAGAGYAIPLEIRGVRL
jgi:hypothetical protein